MTNEEIIKALRVCGRGECDECRWWHGADPRYRIQTRCECERYREARQAVERRAEAARKKFTIINGEKING